MERNTGKLQKAHLQAGRNPYILPFGKGSGHPLFLLFIQWISRILRLKAQSFFNLRTLF
jgi:hypothetical protein